MSNIKTVQSIYEAFGRGDIPAILEKLDENVDWEYGALPNNVPWLQPLQGQQHVAKFFESLGALDFQVFNVKNIVGEDKLVIALFDVEAKIKHNGKMLKEVDEVHIWHFNDAGKVIAFRHRLDTHQHMQAFAD